MDADTEPITKRTRFSKNKKKNWGKFDQKEIDAALDKARSDERLHGGDLTEVKNEDLFVIDTGKGKKKEPVKRMTNVDRILSNKSMVPPPCEVENKKMTNRAILLRNRKEVNRAKTAHLRADALKKVCVLILVRDSC